MKKNEQMYALLSIALALCPDRVDEHVNAVIREKHADKILRMQRHDEACFEELFAYACPKFVTAIPPPMPAEVGMPGSTGLNSSQDAFRFQMKLFMTEIRQSIQIPTLRSFLSLYTTMGLKKLASFLEIPNEEDLSTLLLCYKHKTFNKKWTPDSELIEGEFRVNSDTDFKVVAEGADAMLHITECKPGRRHGDFFVRQINKFEEIIEGVAIK